MLVYFTTYIKWINSLKGTNYQSSFKKKEVILLTLYKKNYSYI